MSLGYNRWDDPQEGFPRVSGDEPFSVFSRLDRIQFSPRERG